MGRRGSVSERDLSKTQKKDPVLGKRKEQGTMKNALKGRCKRRN